VASAFEGATTPFVKTQGVPPGVDDSGRATWRGTLTSSATSGKEQNDPRKKFRGSPSVELNRTKLQMCSLIRR
jgi:hypothetical protein